MSGRAARLQRQREGVISAAAKAAVERAALVVTALAGQVRPRAEKMSPKALRSMPPPAELLDARDRAQVSFLQELLEVPQALPVAKGGFITPKPTEWDSAVARVVRVTEDDELREAFGYAYLAMSVAEFPERKDDVVPPYGVNAFQERFPRLAGVVTRGRAGVDRNPEADASAVIGEILDLLFEKGEIRADELLHGLDALDRGTGREFPF